MEIQLKLTSEEIIRSVQLRFRVCSYLFRLGAIFIFVGFTVNLLHWSPSEWIPFSIELTGAGIFFSAFVLTLAIYRCPVCDCYLSRFRPRKDQCPHCGAKIR